MGNNNSNAEKEPLEHALVAATRDTNENTVSAEPSLVIPAANMDISLELANLPLSQ